MIVGFACKETEKIWRGEMSRRLPKDIQEITRRKLRMLHNAHALDDLRIPPNNRLEKLRGDRSDSYSIRINNQWRICFSWHEGNVNHVEMVDYH